MRTIQYSIDQSTGLVVSRVGSELAWPMEYNLEKIPVSATAGYIWSMLKWTRKIPVADKNIHRAFWSMKPLKG